MAALRIEENFVLSSELALELSQVASHPVHKVPTYSFRLLLAPSGSESRKNQPPSRLNSSH
jgi:hypothetical protein